MKYINEIEGFNLKSQFILKEAAVLNYDSGIIQHFFIKPPYSYKRLSESDTSIVQYSQRFLHRINWRRGNAFMRTFTKLIKDLPDHSIIYTKGQQKVEILKSYKQNLNVINLEDKFDLLPITRIKNIPDNICPLHFHENLLNCAHIKVRTFYREIQKES